MNKYAITLKPILAAGGLEGLDQTKRTIFDGLVYATAKMFEASQEIDDVEITKDFNIILTANKDIYDFLKQKLSENVVITKLHS